MGIVKEHRVYRRKKRRKYAIIIILSILFLFLIFLKASKIKQIKVVGNSRYKQEDIVQMLKKNTVYDNALYLYYNYRYGSPKNLPLIKDVTIKRTGINTLSVRVYEKKIYGCMQYFNQYIYFDKDGVVVESSDKLYKGIPVVTGLVLDSVILSEKLATQKDKLFETIKDITQLIQKYNIKVNAIHFDSAEAVTLYVDSITILLGKREMYDEQIAELVNMLPKLKGKKGILHLEDFVIGNKTFFEITK